ncbi:MAG: hypothetical protein ACXW2U_10540 [Telluria sp.]
MRKLPGIDETAKWPADYVRLASPVGGTVAMLFVQRGSAIRAGAPAFVLEQESERAARQEASARLQRAQARLADLQQGRRPEELRSRASSWRRPRLRWPCRKPTWRAKANC